MNWFPSKVKYQDVSKEGLGHYYRSGVGDEVYKFPKLEYIIFIFQVHYLTLFLQNLEATHCTNICCPLYKCTIFCTASAWIKIHADASFIHNIYRYLPEFIKNILSQVEAEGAVVKALGQHDCLEAQPPIKCCIHTFLYCYPHWG